MSDLTFCNASTEVRAMLSSHPAHVCVSAAVRFITLQSAMKLLGITKSGVLKALSRNRLEGFKVPQGWMFSLMSVKNYSQTRRSRKS